MGALDGLIPSYVRPTPSRKPLKGYHEMTETRQWIITWDDGTTDTVVNPLHLWTDSDLTGRKAVTVVEQKRVITEKFERTDTGWHDVEVRETTNEH